MEHAIFWGISVLLTALFWIRRGHRPENFSNMAPSADHFIARLQQLGYFEYTAPEHLQMLQLVLTGSLSADKGMSTIEDEQTGLPVDLRVYSISGEKLAAGGSSVFLKKLNTAFERMKIPVIQKELLFDAIQPGRMIAELAAFVNKHLEASGAKEKVFVSGDTQNAKIIFLTKAQHSFISTVIKNRNIQPLELKMWAKWNRLI